jgi:uncharacterized protein (TIGR02677 family)
MIQRHKTFAYVQAEHYLSYRLILQAFTQARRRYVLHLRPDEVLSDLQTCLQQESQWLNQNPNLQELLSKEALEAPLQQLCDWGNLEAQADNSEVSTIEEFHRKRYLYRLTPEGDAAVAAIEVYESNIIRPGELQSAALGDIHELLISLEQELSQNSPDVGKIFRDATYLNTRFEELTSKAQAFISSLMRNTDLQTSNIEAFLAYKKRLIEYLEKFIGELRLMSVQIRDDLERLKPHEAQLFVLCVGRSLADRLDNDAAAQHKEQQLWQSRWEGLSSWFCPSPKSSSQADRLRQQALTAINSLLNTVNRLNERHSAQSDHGTDLLTLAQWFAECNNDSEAHLLWRETFSLHGCRHFKINGETLAAHAELDKPAHTSWFEAPPMRISPRLRQSGVYKRRGRNTPALSLEVEKKYLAELNRKESEQLEKARRQLLTPEPTALSQWKNLSSQEFDLFLDLLSESLRSKVQHSDVVEATSSDGSLRMVMTPVQPRACFSIQTELGTFSGDDHIITIEDALGVTRATQN